MASTLLAKSDPIAFTISCSQHRPEVGKDTNACEGVQVWSSQRKAGSAGAELILLVEVLIPASTVGVVCRVG
jgi:hypothetical protein